jgi:hypothetical protein
LYPLTEGIRLAKKLSNEVYLVALFRNAFEMAEDTFVYFENVDAS